MFAKLLKPKFVCNFCNKPTSYSSIERSLGDQLNKHGFPYSLDDFETLNYKEYTCVNCRSSDRDRLYRLYIEQYENLPKNAAVLDFAPSKLFESFMRPQATGYRSADLLIDTYDDKIDITNMKQYKDNSFDFFVCSHVVEHVDDDTKAFKELYRVLKPGGRGIIMTPIIDKPGVHDEDPAEKKVSERWRRFAQDDHVRLYEKSVFLKRIKQAGFNVREYTVKDFGKRLFKKHGISLKSRLYVVEKR